MRGLLPTSFLRQLSVCSRLLSAGRVSELLLLISGFLRASYIHLRQEVIYNMLIWENVYSSKASARLLLIGVPDWERQIVLFALFRVTMKI